MSRVYMSRVVEFRKFEERDIDFIYRCKNNEKLNSSILFRMKRLHYGFTIV